MATEKERFEILLEEIRSQLQLVIEGYQMLDQKIDRHVARIDRRIDDLETTLRIGFKRVHERIDAVEIRLANVEKGLNRVEKRLDAVEGRFDTLDSKINGVETRFTEKLELHEKLHHRN